MNHQVYSLDEIHAMVTPILRRYNAVYALLFGSYARNEATPQSDIDLVIVGKDSFKPLDIFAIAEDLHECSGKAVDVYEIREVKQDSPFYQAIMSECVVLR
ncbi:MAG: nucleotidyltransferase family protein [Candidatus Ventricola sp.]